MARILSISYDEALLVTRELMLRGAGHDVTSALGLHDSREACTRGPFDLAIIGHSIPRNDKLEFISAFRQSNPVALVIALTRAGEERLSVVDAYVYPGDPESLIRTINALVDPATERRTELRRVK
ncbi:MAG: hypothetical protein ACRD3E_14500 [Terriglobales bacterium]